jgi:ribosomal protein S18 acetylase RimI-like enzyme
MLTVRRASEQDFSEILRIQAEAFGEYEGIYEVSPWTKETLENIKLNALDKVILVAELDGRVVGSVRYAMAGGVCVIRLLSVARAHQRRGIGKTLLLEIEQLADEAHKLYACTMLRTPRNIALFLNLGYRPESLLPDHYHHTDLICFAKYVTPGGPSSF